MGQTQINYARFVGEQEDGWTRSVRNVNVKDGQELIGSFDGFITLKHTFQEACKKYADQPCFGTRRKEGDTFKEYVWTDYKTVYERSHNLAKSIYKRDLCPTDTFEGDGDFNFIAIYAKNREEWAQTDFACVMSGITSVALYDTLGKESMEHIVSQCRVRTVVLSADKIKTITSYKNDGKLATMKTIIHFDEAKEEDVAAAQAAGFEVLSYAQLLTEGAQLTDEEANYNSRKVLPDTVYTISYTSGTTGVPKGVMLTQRNLTANIGSYSWHDSNQDIALRPGQDVYISYLPLAHVFERFMYGLMFAKGVQIGFFQGDVFKLKEDLAELKPTIMASVPRLFNRFYDVMQQKINELQGFKRTLTEWGIQKKLANLEQNAAYTHTFYDSLVFSKFAAVLGGRVRLMVTGSAPISKDVLKFLKIAFCAPICEGYGQTECCGAASCTFVSDPEVGHIGGPYPACDFRLQDLPEMNYTAKDKDENGNPMPRGEICIRGFNVFKGYFQMPDKTAETLDNEGWLHTGDVGCLNSNGTIRIIDRKKNIFKLSQGEYVAPEKLEQSFQQMPLVAQNFMYGDSLQSTMVGIIVPEKPVLEQWAKDNNVEGDYAALCENQAVKDMFVAELKKKGKAEGFFGFEIPTKVFLSSEPFSVDNEILTPTFKIKRNDAKKYFYKQIKEMYGGAKLQGEGE